MVDRSRPYPSCSWLESGIAFNRRSLHACLVFHHGRGLPKLLDYEGGLMPVEKVLTARNEIIFCNQHGGHEACLGCANLITKRWRPPQYAFETIGIAHFTHCNLRFHYCFLQNTPNRSNLAGGDRPYRVRPILQQLIDEKLIAPRAVIDWGGGEPTIYPEFDEVFELTALRGASSHIHTNGTRVPVPIKRRSRNQKVHLVCSIDAGTCETYRRIKQVDLYDRVWENLAEYQQLGCRLIVKYIVMEDNCHEDELVAFVKQVQSIGSPKVLVDIDYNRSTPSPAVLRGLRELVSACRRCRIPVDVGFTGAVHTPELGLKELVLGKSAANLKGRLRNLSRRLIRRLFEGSCGLRRFKFVWPVVRRD